MAFRFKTQNYIFDRKPICQTLLFRYKMRKIGLDDVDADCPLCHREE